MFVKTDVELPVFCPLDELEDGLKLAGDVRAKNGEISLSKNTHLSGRDIDQLRTSNWESVPVYVEETHFSAEIPRQDLADNLSWMSDLIEGYRDFLVKQDTRKLIESLAEIMDQLRIFEGVESHEVCQKLLDKSYDFEQKREEIRQELISADTDRAHQLKDVLNNIVKGEEAEFSGASPPGEYTEAIMELVKRRVELYDQAVTLFRTFELELQNISEAIPSYEMLEEPSETGREYLLSLRKSRVEDLDLEPYLSSLREDWIDSVLEPPAFDEGDWELSLITARVKQILENLLVRGIFMKTLAFQLMTLIEEKVATGEELYRRLTFPLKDQNYMLSHIVNVLVISLYLAKESGLDLEERRELGVACLFFDIGMLKLNPDLWTQGLKPEGEEVDQIQEHPIFSAQWLQEIHYPFQSRTLNSIRQHHERLDASGYPQGIEREQMTFGTRILIVADVYDAMSTSRPHRSAIHPDKIITYLKNRTNKFDPEVVKTLEEKIGPYPPGTVVQLESNEIGVSLEQGEDPAQPRIKLVIDSAGRVYDDPETIDLSQDDERKIAETIGSRNTPNALLKYMT